ncbi:MAG: hypothetical protein HZB54_06245 [Deltaproteobacteria bacterium]|nr:hypothetical protein [Deltaproteobacteria bacterium]
MKLNLPSEDRVSDDMSKSEMHSQAKYKTIITIALLVILYLLVHTPLIKTYKTAGFDISKGQKLDDRTIMIGDYSYYLHGALSIFDFEVEKKFNDKHYPIIGQQRRIVENDMPWYAKYVLIFYPNPSFKFGYSLSAALITAPLPQSLFSYHIHRLIFVNIIFISLTIGIIFLIVKKITGDYAPAVIAVLFFIFDVSNAHNSYSYQSHTMSGIFYLLLSYYLFVKIEKVTPFRLGLIAFLLVFALLSSSHVVPLAIFMGLFIHLSACYAGYIESKLNVLKYTVAGIVGSLIWPLYIIGVETLFNFRSLGLPTTAMQLENYRRTVNELIKTYPVHLRFMWDLRLFNIFIIYILLMALFIIIYQRHTSHSAERQQQKPNLILSLKECIVSNRDYYILFFTIILATLVTAFYTQPISRGMTPYTILYGILFAIFLGKRFTRGGMPVKVFIASIVFLFFLNFYLTFHIIKLPDNKPSNDLIVINEDDIISKNAHAFYRENKTDAYEYHIISKSIKEFINDHDATIKNGKNTYIEFDAMNLVNVYTPTRRFIYKFVPNKKDVVTQKTFFKDFRLLAEIFALYQKGLLSDSDIVRRKRWVWDFITWDQEYNYIYGYSNYVKKYLKGTPLEQLNPHYIYYINYGALKKAILKEQSQEILDTLEKARLESPSPAWVIFSDTEMNNKNWIDHQSPEKNELLAKIDENKNCRHVVDSTPSFGGIINANSFSLAKGKDYEVEFKMKVVHGEVTMQVVMNYGVKPEYTNLGGIANRDWTIKTTSFNSNKQQLAKINFTNSSGNAPAEFYICDVYIRKMQPDD